MGRWKDFKDAIDNPPEERLCLINANGYKVGMLSVIVISFFIFQTVIWYISFIFIVQLVSNWVGYKREMKQYNAIITAKKSMGVYQEIEKDPSFTRRRFRLISDELGSSINYIVTALITVPSVLFLDIGSRTILGKILIMLFICLTYGILMLYPVHWIARFKRSLKNGV